MQMDDFVFVFTYILCMTHNTQILTSFSQLTIIYGLNLLNCKILWCFFIICWADSENKTFSSFFSQRKWRILSLRKITRTQLQLRATPLILQGTLGWQPLQKVQRLSPKKLSQKQNLQNPRKLLIASVKLIDYQE